MPLNGKVLALVCVGVLAWAPAALAGPTKTYAPPGKAGTSEYAEVIPTSGGNVSPPAMTGGNRSAAEISRLGSGRIGTKKLAKLGTQGAAAAQFATATAPARTGPMHTTPLGTSESGSALASGGSLLAAVGRLLAGDDVDGIGVFFPLLLAFGLGTALGVSATRVRRAREKQA